MRNKSGFELLGLGQYSLPVDGLKLDWKQGQFTTTPDSVFLLRPGESFFSVLGLVQGKGAFKHHCRKEEAVWAM